MTRASIPLTDNITREMLTVVKNAPQPLSVEEIGAALSCGIDPQNLLQALQSEVENGNIHQWPAMRGDSKFWMKAPADAIHNHILQLLVEAPLTRTELVQRLSKILPDIVEKEMERALPQSLEALIENKEIFEHPPVAGGRVSRYGLNPPDLLSYFTKIQKEYRSICEKLNRAGISTTTVYQAVCDLFASPACEKPYSSALSGADKNGVTPTLLKRILTTVHQIEPAADRQALVSIPLLRKTMGLPKAAFDEAILTLAQQEKIWLHRHVDPAQMDAVERSRLVSDRRGNYYMGLVLRD